MLDRSELDEAVDAIVEELADSRQCIISRPEAFEGRVLDVAAVHGKGVTTVMGHVARRVTDSSRFNPTRKQQILSALKERGVGVVRPELVCF